MFYTVLVILIVLASILMIGVVLIQESKGGGLSSNFSSINSVMGVRKTSNGVEKLTWALAALMVVLSVVCTWQAPKSAADQSVIEKTATPTNTATPGFGASQQAAPAAGAQNGAAAPAAGAQNAPAAPAAPAK